MFLHLFTHIRLNISWKLTYLVTVKNYWHRILRMCLFNLTWKRVWTNAFDMIVPSRCLDFERPSELREISNETKIQNAK